VRLLLLCFSVSDFFGTTPTLKMCAGNYKYFKISSVLRWDFRKQTHYLYMQISTTDHSPTKLEANRSILNTLSEQYKHTKRPIQVNLSTLKYSAVGKSYEAPHYVWQRKYSKEKDK
jgi:hypothetical protein